MLLFITPQIGGNPLIARALAEEEALSWTSNAPDYTFKWVNSWGGPNWDWASVVAVDSERDVVYTAGRTDSYGAGAADAFLHQYSFNGSLLWNHTWGGSAQDEATGLVVGSDGSVYLAGGTGSYGAGRQDVFLAKFSPAGDQLWNRTWGSPAIERDVHMEVTAADHVIITGELFNTNTGNGQSNLFLLCYTEGGILLWNNTWPGLSTSGTITVGGLTVDLDGSVLVTGYEKASLRPSKGFLLKFQSSGVLLWNTTLDTPSSETRLFGVTSGNNESIWVVGYLLKDNPSGLVQCFNQNGSLAWYRHWKLPSPSGIYLREVSNTFDGSMIVGGTLDPSGGINTSIVFASISNSGEGNWNLTWRDVEDPSLRDLTVSKGSDLFIVGESEESNRSAFLVYFASFTPKSRRSIAPSVETAMFFLIAGAITNWKRRKRLDSLNENKTKMIK